MIAARAVQLDPLPLPPAAEVEQQLLADAFDGVPNARELRTLARLTHAGEAAWLERLGRLLGALQHQRRADLKAVAERSLRPEELEAWPPQPARLWLLLLDMLRREFLQGKHREPRPWQIAQALQHGSSWLCDAARLAQREQHRMRRAGGWRLPAPKIDGEHLVAELCDPTPGPGSPSGPGQLLRLTWGRTAHFVVQSVPGNWSEPDLTCEPS